MHDVVFVPRQFPTIQEAVDAVTGPASIVIDPGLYRECVTVADKKSVVIQSARLTRRGVTIGGVLSVARSALYLSGIEIRSNGTSRGISAQDATLSLQDCVIAGNRTDEAFGAAMFCRNAAVRVQKTAIVGNTVDSEAEEAGGGGLYFRDCRIEIAGTTIQGNAVYGIHDVRGGGIWCERSAMRMWRSRVTDNALQGPRCEGGGIYFADPRECRLGGSVITGNGSAEGRGGGIFVRGEATRVHVHGNTVVRLNHPVDVAFA